MPNPHFVGKSGLGARGDAMPEFDWWVGDWKYIEPNKGAALNKNINTELGNFKNEQLYNLKSDEGEKVNLAEKHPEKVADLKAL